MRFDHVKLVVSDFGRLIDFYCRVFECTVRLGEVESEDEGLLRAIGAPEGSRFRVALLSLPGDGSSTLELYALVGAGSHRWPYSAGQGQLAFRVEDVDATVALVLENGGSMLGSVDEWLAPSGRMARLAFVRDPEGNLIDVFGAA